MQIGDTAVIRLVAEEEPTFSAKSVTVDISIESELAKLEVTLFTSFHYRVIKATTLTVCAFSQLEHSMNIQFLFIF